MAFQASRNSQTLVIAASYKALSYKIKQYRLSADLEPSVD